MRDLSKGFLNIFLTLPVYFFHTHRTPEPRRLVFAFLLSLVLHVLLLFFVRLAPPSWKGSGGTTPPLQVILNSPQPEIAKPSAIAPVSQDNHGASRVGVQHGNPPLKHPLAAALAPPVEQARTTLPQTFTGKNILALDKPGPANHAELTDSMPDLLATRMPEPEVPEDKDKPYAAAPEVAGSAASAVAPAQQLVSAEPAPEAEKEKIVFVEPAQAELPHPQHEALAESPPDKIDAAIPVKVAAPEPVKVEQPKPVKVELPKPPEPEKPAPAKIEVTEPARTLEPPPLKTGEIAQPPTQEAAPAQAEAAPAPPAPPVAGRGTESFRPAPPAYHIPSLAELSMDSVRGFASDAHRKIQFGERRKTVNIREQDLRYAMYVESVLLKLQRIGALNYPAAAARANLSGSLGVIISIRADGSLEDFSLTRPSYEALNQGAERIARMSAPFSPLPDNIKRDTDILNIRINWSFSSSNQSLD